MRISHTLVTLSSWVLLCYSEPYGERGPATARPAILARRLLRTRTCHNIRHADNDYDDGAHYQCRSHPMSTMTVRVSVIIFNVMAITTNTAFNAIIITTGKEVVISTMEGAKSKLYSQMSSSLSGKSNIPGMPLAIETVRRQLCR